MPPELHSEGSDHDEGAHDPARLQQPEQADPARRPDPPIVDAPDVINVGVEPDQHGYLDGSTPLFIPDTAGPKDQE